MVFGLPRTWIATPLIVAVLSVPAGAATTTIDFETPALGDGPSQVLLEYVANGVRFTNSLPPCAGPAPMSFGRKQVCADDASTSQMLSGSRGTRLFPLAGIFRADFPPGAVNQGAFVAVDVQTEVAALPGAGLVLHDAAGLVVGYSDEASTSVPALCTGAAAVRLSALATGPVAYALIAGGRIPDCQCAATDGCGCCEAAFAIDNFTFGDCLDESPPELAVTLAPAALWPPNHRMVEVRAVIEVRDDCDASPAVTLVSLESDEPDQGTGDEDLPGDIEGAEVGAADHEFALRAERAEEGGGRTYTACYEARDASGHTTRACATVAVPHDRRGRATLLGSPARSSLAIHGGPTMAARDVAVTTVAVVSEAGGGTMASGAPPEFGDLDGDGHEDAIVALDGVPAGAIDAGASLHAHWSAAGQGYLAELASPTVTGVGGGSSGRLEAAASPNPGWREATLRFALPRAGLVRLRIFDVAGHRVATLVEGWRTAGRHAARFAPGVSGIYLYRLDWAGESRSGKFAVLR